MELYSEWDIYINDICTTIKMVHNVRTLTLECDNKKIIELTFEVNQHKP